MVQDLQGKYSVAGETSRNTSPREGEAKSSRENSVERQALMSSALVDKIIKRSKVSSFGKFISGLPFVTGFLISTNFSCTYLGCCRLN